MKIEVITLVDWVSFGLSLTALVMTTLIAIVGIILTWLNHQKEYDPMIVLGSFRTIEDSSNREIRVRNLGRGSAFNIRIIIYDDKKVKYRVNSIDIIPPNEFEYIPDEIFRQPENEFTDILDLDNNNKTLLYHIIYRTETRRKKEIYFANETIPSWFTKITKRKFNKYVKEETPPLITLNDY